MPWWPADEWADKLGGAGCFMCDSADRSNAESDLVEETAHSFIHLKRNQGHPGAATVISKRHVPELHHLESGELQGFMTDVARVSRAVERLFDPVKVNQLILGNVCPHLHCHVLPQHACDDPTAVPYVHDRCLRLSEQEQRDRVEALRTALRSLTPSTDAAVGPSV